MSTDPYGFMAQALLAAVDEKIQLAAEALRSEFDDKLRAMREDVAAALVEGGTLA